MITVATLATATPASASAKVCGCGGDRDLWVAWNGGHYWAGQACVNIHL